MIRDYDRRSGVQGALRSLIGERVVGALISGDNRIMLFFETGCAVGFRAWDNSAMRLCPMEDALAVVKEQIRDANLHQANLTKALKQLGDQKCAGKPKTCYVDSSN